MISSLLASGNWRHYNKTLAKACGAVSSILISELADRQDFFERCGKTEDGFFYAEYESIAEETGLGKDQIVAIVKKLETEGILETRLAGMPRRKYYRLNAEKISEIIHRQNFPKASESEKTDESINVKNQFIETGKTSLRKREKPAIYNGDYNTENITEIKNTAVAVLEKKKKSNSSLLDSEAFGIALGVIAKTSSELSDKILEFAEYRKATKKPMNVVSFQSWMKKLSTLGNGNVETMIEILDQSIANGWTGIFATKNHNSNISSKPARGTIG